MNWLIALLAVCLVADGILNVLVAMSNPGRRKSA